MVQHVDPEPGNLLRGIDIKEDINKKLRRELYALFAVTHLFITHCANRYERYQSQYRFINPLESVLNKFPKSISTMTLQPHRRPFEKINIENEEAFAL